MISLMMLKKKKKMKLTFQMMRMILLRPSDASFPSLQREGRKSNPYALRKGGECICQMRNTQMVRVIMVTVTA
jgi:TPP-dependent pyruvate/acetoin dehydrogenase alpha subunit